MLMVLVFVSTENSIRIRLPGAKSRARSPYNNNCSVASSACCSYQRERDVFQSLMTSSSDVSTIRSSRPNSGGSGSTLIAAEQTGRKAFLMELDCLYADVIVQRFEKFTGKKAERIKAVNDQQPTAAGG